MQDLSARVPGIIVSAMDGGNMVSSNTIANPGAPGSVPITPMPEAPNMLDAQLPLPKLGAQIPVSNMSHRVTSTTTTDPSRPPDRPARWTPVTVASGTDKPSAVWSTGPFTPDAP